MKTIEEEIRSVVRSELLAAFGSFKRRGPGRGPGRPKGSKNKKKPGTKLPDYSEKP